MSHFAFAPFFLYIFDLNFDSDIMKIYLYTITVFLLFSMNLYSQLNRTYTIDDNLSSSLVNQIIQDDKGFIWIATEYGLNKFDGYKFTTYKHNKKDPLSIMDNYVRTIFQDSKKNIWVGFINGLMKYNPNTDTFEKIDIIRGKNKMEARVVSIIETRKGEIWLSTSGYGIFKIINNGGHYSTSHQLKNKLSSEYISAIYEDSRSRIWFANSKYGLECYDTTSGKLKSYHITDSLSPENITSITGNDDGFVFIGTEKNGIAVYNPYKDKINSVPYKDQLYVRALSVNNKNDLLIGTDGQGLKIYKLQTNTIEDHEINLSPYNVSKARIHSIARDKLNNLWLGLYLEGVGFITNPRKDFKHITLKSFGINSVNNNPTWAIFKDHSNTLWIGTDNNGIYAFNQDLKEIGNYKQSQTSNSTQRAIYAIFEDSNNELWIGTYSNGLAKFDKKSKRYHFIPELLNEKIYSITEDKKKRLIVGTLGSGLYIIDISGNNNNVINLKSSRNKTFDLKSDELPNDWINCLMTDRDGLIWIGHYKGLSCYNPQKNTFINYIQNNIFTPETVILSLFEDYLGNIYAGSKDGLYTFNKKDKSLKHYTTDDGLSDDAICGITDDESHNLWISTYKGLNKLDIRTKRFTNFFVNDGLQNNEFQRGAIYKDNNGIIYLGGTNGITYFSPMKILDDSIKQKLYITDFYINNMPIQQGSKSGNNQITNDAVINTKVFTLSYKDNTFSFDLSTLDYFDPKQISFQYKILSDKNWISLPLGMNRVTFSGLSYGEHTIEIRALLSNRISTDTKKVIIKITPPWYHTWWAYTIYIFFVISLFIGIINYILSQIRYRKEISEKEQAKIISEEKLQFFTNISHELRTPMTLIMSPLETLMRNKSDSEESKVYKLMYRNAQRILNLLNQIMDIRKLDKRQIQLLCSQTDIVSFINDIRDIFEVLAQKKQINLTFTHSVDSLDVWIDLNNFDKVLLNVLSNAFKFTPEHGTINILLTTSNNSVLGDFFQISINDTGIGVSEEESEKIFDRFYQSRNNSLNFGTGIGLHLSRSIVELHKGTIHVENRQDAKGCNFIIRLPLGKEHLNDSQMVNQSSKYYLELDRNTIKSHENINEFFPTFNNYNKITSKMKPCIVIVDDDDEIRQYLEEVFAKEYNIYTSDNGKEALQYILKEKPDVVLSDIIMPLMDGISMTKKIKANINTNDIPIILLSAKNSIQDKLEALGTEADAYFEKPFNIEILKYTVSNFISNRRKLLNKYSGNERLENLIDPIEAKSSDTILLEKIMSIINKHIDDPSLNVQMLSDEVGISRGHLHRKLKELTNQSVSSFIRNIRLEQAAKLLSESKLTISETLYATGFSSISHFSNSFKDFYGVSPSEYITLIKKKAESGE